VPGVQSAATTAALPLNQGSWTVGFERADRPPPPPGERPDAGVLWVSTGYRRTLDIPLRAGRDFAATDSAGAVHVALVNEAFARRHFPGEDPLGKRIRVGASFYAEGEWPIWEIAGVLGDVRQWGLDKEPRPEIFLPQSQQGMPRMNLLVRSRLPRAQLVQAVRAELAAIAPEQPLGPVLTLEEVAAGSVGGRRIQAIILGSAALVGLLLAALGVYGLIAWSVAQRTGEMGIRLALGAQPSQVLRMVVGEGLRLAAIGLALGLLGALAAGQALRSSLYGTSPADPLVYAAVAALLACVVALASFLPARRAARISPLQALRAE
jgi:putative ABC transport system permease protein